MNPFAHTCWLPPKGTRANFEAARLEAHHA